VGQRREFEQRCSHCGHSTRLDAMELAAQLRSLGMLKRDDDREPEFLLQLASVASGKLTCASCGSGVKISLADDADEWNLPRKDCAACGTRIPPERIAIYPDMDLCAACQAKAERGQTPDVHDDYCPRCGTRMVVRQRRGSGIAAYEQVCPACRR
jgi:DNA-directed RNA polymerase subunit RPC12/RpoP